jgi:hypothetical protein
MEFYSEAHLLSLASTLGVQTENLYLKDTQCEASLQDIIRFLRNDTSGERKYFLQLTSWNVLRKDVIPLLLTYHSEPNILFLSIKLLVFMTLPPEIDSENNLEQVRALSRALRSILENKQVLSVAMFTLSGSLQKFEDGKTHETCIETKLFQLVLTMFRNVLLIADLCKNNPDHQELRAEVCSALVECHFMDALSTIIQVDFVLLSCTKLLNLFCRT